MQVSAEIYDLLGTSKTVEVMQVRWHHVTCSSAVFTPANYETFPTDCITFKLCILHLSKYVTQLLIFLKSEKIISICQILIRQVLWYHTVLRKYCIWLKKKPWWSLKLNTSSWGIFRKMYIFFQENACLWVFCNSSQTYAFYYKGSFLLEFIFSFS